MIHKRMFDPVLYLVLFKNGQTNEIVGCSKWPIQKILDEAEDFFGLPAKDVILEKQMSEEDRKYVLDLNKRIAKAKQAARQREKRHGFYRAVKRRVSVRA